MNPWLICITVIVYIFLGSGRNLVHSAGNVTDSGASEQNDAASSQLESSSRTHGTPTDVVDVPSEDDEGTVPEDNNIGNPEEVEADEADDSAIIPENQSEQQSEDVVIVNRSKGDDSHSIASDDQSTPRHSSRRGMSTRKRNPSEPINKSPDVTEAQSEMGAEEVSTDEDAEEVIIDEIVEDSADGTIQSDADQSYIEDIPGSKQSYPLARSQSEVDQPVNMAEHSGDGVDSDDEAAYGFPDETQSAIEDEGGSQVVDSQSIVSDQDAEPIVSHKPHKRANKAKPKGGNKSPNKTVPRKATPIEGKAEGKAPKKSQKIKETVKEPKISTPRRSTRSATPPKVEKPPDPVAPAIDPTPSEPEDQSPDGQAAAHPTPTEGDQSEHDEPLQAEDEQQPTDPTIDTTPMQPGKEDLNPPTVENDDLNRQVVEDQAGPVQHTQTVPVPAEHQPEEVEKHGQLPPVVDSQSPPTQSTTQPDPVEPEHVEPTAVTVPSPVQNPAPAAEPVVATPIPMPPPNPVQNPVPVVEPVVSTPPTQPLPTQPLATETVSSQPFSTHPPVPEPPVLPPTQPLPTQPLATQPSPVVEPVVATPMPMPISSQFQNAGPVAEPVVVTPKSPETPATETQPVPKSTKDKATQTVKEEKSHPQPTPEVKIFDKTMIKLFTKHTNNQLVELGADAYELRASPRSAKFIIKPRIRCFMVEYNNKVLWRYEESKHRRVFPTDLNFRIITKLEVGFPDEPESQPEQTRPTMGPRFVPATRTVEGNLEQTTDAVPIPVHQTVVQHNTDVEHMGQPSKARTIVYESPDKSFVAKVRQKPAGEERSEKDDKKPRDIYVHVKTGTVEVKYKNP